MNSWKYDCSYTLTQVLKVSHTYTIKYFQCHKFPYVIVKEVLLQAKQADIGMFTAMVTFTCTHYEGQVLLYSSQQLTSWCTVLAPKVCNNCMQLLFIKIHRSIDHGVDGRSCWSRHHLRCSGSRNGDLRDIGTRLYKFYYHFWLILQCAYYTVASRTPWQHIVAGGEDGGREVVAILAHPNNDVCCYNSIDSNSVKHPPFLPLQRRTVVNYY